MKITLNGQSKEFNQISNLEKLIEQCCSEKTPVIAELNGEIIKGLHWENTALKDGDRVELVSFVGGGSSENRNSLIVVRGYIY